MIFVLSEDAASAVETPVEEVAIPTDKKSKKKSKSSTSLADGTVSTTTVALTTNETEATIIDKKSVKKRVKHFLKKHKSGNGTPMKPESKLSKIQKSMMGKNSHQYQSVPVMDEVRLRIFYQFLTRI